MTSRPDFNDILREQGVEGVRASFDRGTSKGKVLATKGRARTLGGTTADTPIIAPTSHRLSRRAMRDGTSSKHARQGQIAR